MSPEFKILVIVAFFAWVLCSVFYSQVVRPVLRDCVRFKLFALRDDLRRMAVMGEIAPSSFNYSYLEGMLCRLINRCFWYTWSSFFEFILRFRNAQPPVDACRFDEKAPPALKRIFDDTMRIMLRALVVNSPVITVVVFAVVVVAGSFGAAWKRWLKLQAKLFFQEPLEVVDPAESLRLAQV